MVLNEISLTHCFRSGQDFMEGFFSTADFLVILQQVLYHMPHVWINYLLISVTETAELVI